MSNPRSPFRRAPTCLGPWPPYPAVRAPGRPGPADGDRPGRLDRLRGTVGRRREHDRDRHPGRRTRPPPARGNHRRWPPRPRPRRHARRPAGYDGSNLVATAFDTHHNSTGATPSTPSARSRTWARRPRPRRTSSTCTPRPRHARRRRRAASARSRSRPGSPPGREDRLRAGPDRAAGPARRARQRTVVLHRRPSSVAHGSNATATTTATAGRR